MSLQRQIADLAREVEQRRSALQLFHQGNLRLQHDVVVRLQNEIARLEDKKIQLEFELETSKHNSAGQANSFAGVPLFGFGGIPVGGPRVVAGNTVLPVHQVGAGTMAFLVQHAAAGNMSHVQRVGVRNVAHAHHGGAGNMAHVHHVGVVNHPFSMANGGAYTLGPNGAQMFFPL
jgi:hypothetical protein